MTMNTAISTSALLANEVGYDPIKDRLRLNIRALIEAVSRRNWSSFWAVAAAGAAATNLILYGPPGTGKTYATAATPARRRPREASDPPGNWPPAETPDRGAGASASA